MTLEEIYQRSEEHPIIFFDGVCNLCNGFVNTVIKQDVQGHIHFCSLQSEEGKRISKELGLGEQINTAIGLSKKKIYSHSDVLYMTAKALGGWWSLLLPLYLLPKKLRDIIYNWVARNRYKWFGQKDECLIPDQEVLSRFLPN